MDVSRPRDQNPHAQRDRLQAAGYDRTYIDTISGTLSGRPAFDKALDALRAGDLEPQPRRYRLLAVLVPHQEAQRRGPRPAPAAPQRRYPPR
ncbi:recombinase family protein [Nonomuraea fuscirosea]